MGKATLARQKAIGTIGGGRVQALEAAGLVILYVDDYERLKRNVAELERANKTLREIAEDSTRTNVVAARILKEAIGR